MNRNITKENYNRILSRKTKKNGIYIMLIMLVILGMVIAQVAYLQTFHHYKGVDLNNYKNSMYENTVTQPAQRGIIYDANGNELAININTYDMYAILDPEYKLLNGESYFVQDKENTLNQLINVLGLSNDQKAIELFKSQLNSDAKQVEFSYYGKNLSLEKKREIENLKLPGIEFNENLSRYYPYGDFASYAIGYAKRNDEGRLVGEMGIEQLLNGYLSGEDGKIIQNLDANKNPIPGSEIIEVKPKIDGNNVTLTIDTNIQAYLQEEMNKQYKDKQYEMAYSIITDVKSGKILAMYSSPSFNPNTRDVKNYTNPFTDYCFEPGSTIKTFLIAQAMEMGVWDPNKLTKTGTVTDPQWGGYSVSDWLQNEKGQNWGLLEWAKGYYVSSNTVMIDILKNVGNQKWFNTLKNTFKFGQDASSEMLKTKSCDVSPDYPLDYATTAFGQGMTSNAIQMARAYSAIGNNGIMTTPYLVEKIEDPTTNELIYDSSKDDSLKKEQVISEQTADQVVSEMEMAVTYNEGGYRRGTGQFADGGSIPLAIKTGTSQIAADGNYSSKNGVVTSYATLAPAEDPQMFMYTVVINPTPANDVKYVGEMVKNVSNKVVNYLTKTTSTINIENDTNRFMLEDYTNMNINEVQQNLTNQGIKTIVLGTNKIIKQIPAGNQVISKDETIILRGEGEIDISILKDRDMNQVANICDIMEWNCSFSGIGQATNVINDNGNIVVEFTLPQKIIDYVKKDEENNETNENSK